MNNITTALVVFIFMILTDYCWGVYIKALSESKILKASIYSAFIVVAGSVTAINYVDNHWMIIPAALGAFVGTYLSNIKKK